MCEPTTTKSNKLLALRDLELIYLVFDISYKNSKGDSTNRCDRKKSARDFVDDKQSTCWFGRLTLSRKRRDEEKR